MATETRGGGVALARQMSDSSSPASWDYDVLSVAESGGVSLRHIAFDVFAQEGLVARFGIPVERFQALLERLELLYSVENPYHCALHAADVLAATHCLHKAMPDGAFDDVEVMALYLSALGHDAGHFRLNNAFLKNSKHTLFKKYPESVLENFHLGLLFELLEDQDVGILDRFSPPDRERLVDMITYLILATDMSKHMGLFKAFQEWVQRAQAAHAEIEYMHQTIHSMDSNEDPGEGGIERGDLIDKGTGHQGGHQGGSKRSSLDVDSRTHERWVAPAIANASPEHRKLVMQLLLKCADLGNVVRPLEISDAWGKRIMEEFYQQGEKELALGLPLTTFPNRKNFDYIFARHQNGFLVNVVRPLFEVFTQMTDFDTRESIIACASENGDSWSRRENHYRPGEKKKKGALPNPTPSLRSNQSNKLTRQSTMGWIKELRSPTRRCSRRTRWR